jgi:predicted CXXCH cytochrome family protein
MSTHRFVAAVLMASSVCLSAALAHAQPSSDANTCLTCHSTQQDKRLAAPAALFGGTDVHRESRFACVDCHGGDGSAVDAPHAHAAGRGFQGAPRGAAQIAACARCHSDAELMRRFAPRQRVDQAAEYATSVHGQRLAGGDANVATCVSCHGAHGIRRVSDAKSPVFATNVAATCASCHADAKHMAGYKGPGGAALSTSQFADYQQSVHYRALTTGNDLAAPTCNDCHGNHGAAPPGVGAIANVCGTCHAVFAQKFAASVHREIFDKGCVECHGNHAVAQPSDALVGTGDGALCATCHSGAGDKGAAAADRMRGSIDRLKAGLAQSDALLASIKNAGIEVGAEELSIGEARSRLTLARTELHASDAAAVDKVIAEGLTILAAVDQAGQKGLAELRYRRRGLALSLAAILLVVVALALKVRQIDRRHATAAAEEKIG